MQFPTSSAEAMTQFNRAAQFLTTAYNDASAFAASTYSEISKVAAPCFSKIEISQSGLVAGLNCLKAAWNELSIPAKVAIAVTSVIALNVLVITISILKSACFPNRAAAFKNKVTNAFTAHGVSEKNIEIISGTPHLSPKGVEQFLTRAGCISGNETVHHYFTPALMKKTALNEMGEIRFPLSALKKAGDKATTLAESIHQQYDPASHQAKKAEKTKKD